MQRLAIMKTPGKSEEGSRKLLVTIEIWKERYSLKFGADVENKSLFLQTFTYSSIGMALVSLDGQWMKVNQSFCDLIGYTEEELLSRTFQDITHPDDLAADLDYMQQLLERKIESYQMRKRYVLKQGRVVWVLLNVSMVRDDCGRPLYFLTQVQDITALKRSEGLLLENERKLTEELLRNSEKLTIAGQLAAGIAHEIRNPLTSLKGFLQLIKKGPDYKTEYLDIMEAELDRIEVIVNELLLLAKPTDRKFEEKDVKSMLQNVITLLETQALIHNVQILTAFTPGVTIYCDENQMKQVFINLMKNAIEAMPGGGKLLIQVKKKQELAVIRFIDQGCGIPKEKLKQIGSPFYSTKEDGNGLGLMVSYNIIENHHGKIHIESEIGVGSTFTVSLPIYTPSRLHPAFH